jgi:hypothetical protein
MLLAFALPNPGLVSDVTTIIITLHPPGIYHLMHLQPSPPRLHFPCGLKQEISLLDRIVVMICYLATPHRGTLWILKNDGIQERPLLLLKIVLNSED